MQKKKNPLKDVEGKNAEGGTITRAALVMKRNSSIYSVVFIFARSGDRGKEGGEGEREREGTKE